MKNTPPQFVPSELFVAMAINVMRETDGFRPSSHGDYATSLRVINALQNREGFGGTRPLLDHMGSDVVEGSKMMADLLGDYEYISDSGNIYNVSLDQGELKFKVPEGNLPNGHEDGVDLITKPNPEGGLFIMSSGSPLELILDYDLGLHNEDILSARKVIQSIGDASNMEDCEDSMVSHINGLERGWARIDDKGVVGYLCSNIQKTLTILSPAKLGNIGVEYNPEFVGDLGEKLSTGGEVIKMTSYIKRINRGRSVIESPVTEVQFVTADGNRIKWDASGKTPSDLPIEVGRFYEFSAGKVKGQYYDRASQMNVTDVSNVRATSFKEVLNPSAKYPQLAGGLFMDKLSSAVSVEAKEEKNAPSRPTGLKL